MLKYLRRFLLRLSLEQLVPSQEDKDQLKTLSKRQRQALYRRFTQLSYACNRDDDRASALRIRNVWLSDTRSEKNGIEEEKFLTPQKPSDFLPDVMKDAEAS